MERRGKEMIECRATHSHLMLRRGPAYCADGRGVTRSGSMRSKWVLAGLLQGILVAMMATQLAATTISSDPLRRNERGLRLPPHGMSSSASLGRRSLRVGGEVVVRGCLMRGGGGAGAAGAAAGGNGGEYQGNSTVEQDPDWDELDPEEKMIRKYRVHDLRVLDWSYKQGNPTAFSAARFGDLDVSPAPIILWLPSSGVCAAAADFGCKGCCDLRFRRNSRRRWTREAGTTPCTAWMKSSGRRFTWLSGQDHFRASTSCC